MFFVVSTNSMVLPSFLFYLKENRKKTILMLFLEHDTLVMVEYLVGTSGES